MLDFHGKYFHTFYIKLQTFIYFSISFQFLSGTSFYKGNKTEGNAKFVDGQLVTLELDKV